MPSLLANPLAIAGLLGLLARAALARGGPARPLPGALQSLLNHLESREKNVLERAAQVEAKLAELQSALARTQAPAAAQTRELIVPAQVFAAGPNNFQVNWGKLPVWRDESPALASKTSTFSGIQVHPLLAAQLSECLAQHMQAEDVDGALLAHLFDSFGVPGHDEILAFKENPNFGKLVDAWHAKNRLNPTPHALRLPRNKAYTVSFALLADFQNRWHQPCAVHLYVDYSYEADGRVVHVFSAQSEQPVVLSKSRVQMQVEIPPAAEDRTYSFTLRAHAVPAATTRAPVLNPSDLSLVQGAPQEMAQSLRRAWHASLAHARSLHPAQVAEACVRDGHKLTLKNLDTYVAVFAPAQTQGKLVDLAGRELAVQDAQEIGDYLEEWTLADLAAWFLQAGDVPRTPGSFFHGHAVEVDENGLEYVDIPLKAADGGPINVITDEDIAIKACARVYRYSTLAHGNHLLWDALRRCLAPSLFQETNEIVYKVVCFQPPLVQRRPGHQLTDEEFA
jgi:hypothetical protein